MPLIIDNQQRVSVNKIPCMHFTQFYKENSLPYLQILRKGFLSKRNTINPSKAMKIYFPYSYLSMWCILCCKWFDKFLYRHKLKKKYYIFSQTPLGQEHIILDVLRSLLWRPDGVSVFNLTNDFNKKSFLIYWYWRAMVLQLLIFQDRSR